MLGLLGLQDDCGFILQYCTNHWAAPKFQKPLKICLKLRTYLWWYPQSHMAMNNSPCSSMIVPALKAPFSHPGFCGLLTFISYLDPAGMLGHPVSWVLGSWTSGGPNWCCRSVSKYLAIAFGPSAATSADMVLRDPLKHSKKKAGKKWSPIVDMYLLTFSHKKIHVCYVFTQTWPDTGTLKCRIWMYMAHIFSCDDWQFPRHTQISTKINPQTSSHQILKILHQQFQSHWWNQNFFPSPWPSVELCPGLRSLKWRRFSYKHQPPLLFIERSNSPFPLVLNTHHKPWV